ncbi:hypothetical protein [Streptomyces uncialis]|uniref:hypothetical protein n=1 Tax=Streptomyces uncialis TaxID=1048205 RepID=UPI0033EC83B6
MSHGPQRFTIALPAGMPLLKANDRVHHRIRAERTRMIRGAAMAACSEDPTMRAALVTAGDAPVLQHAYILGIVHPQKNGRFDPANWYPSFKAALDGLIDAGVLEDDDNTRVIGPDMRPGSKTPGGRIALVIQEITAVQHAGFQWPHRDPAVMAG